MQIFTAISNLTAAYSNIVVALGTFDGVHVGHQNIVKQAIELAKSIGGTSVVFSFSNHPLGIVSPSRCPLRIDDNAYKAQLMEALGVNVLMNVPFTEAFLRLSPAEFLNLLKEHLAPQYVVVGPNYSFGYGGKGTPELLVKKSAEFGFVSEIQPAICIGNKIASSTRIRRLIAGGSIEEANLLLGRTFKIRSLIVGGDRRGRCLGFPTANMEIAPGRAVPANGVYAVYANVGGRRFRGLANIGANPTFNGRERRIETHILNFSDDLYDRYLEVEFIKKIRNEMTFQGADALVSQIQTDMQTAKDIFSLQV